MSAKYTAFVDESFHKWFGLPGLESNFCYAALSLPTTRLPDLERFERAIRQFAFSKLPAVNRSNPQPDEFKVTDFNNLSAADIDQIGQKLSCFFAKNDVTIFGYFVPAEGYFNYQLRSDFIDDDEKLKSLPENEYTSRIGNIRQQMLETWERDKQEGKRDLGLLKEVYTQFFNFLVQHHGNYLKQTYSVNYDARNEVEDAALHAHVQEKARVFDRAGFAHYQGFKTMKSSDSAGLRIVDWLVGDIRKFFYKNPPLLAENSQLDVLSPYLNPKMLLIDGRAPFYSKELSEEVKDMFLTPSRGFLMPHIKQFFGSGLLTYYTKHGVARHILIPKLVALDMAD